jgi:hypothetical protein
MAIEFDPSHILFSGRSFLKVEYSDDRVIYDASATPNRDGVEIFARRKGKEWQSEDESRLVVSLDILSPRPTQDGLRYFLPIAADLIKTVTLGLRSTSDLRTEVTALLRRPDLKHVQLLAVETGTNSSSFTRQPISPGKASDN